MNRRRVQQERTKDMVHQAITTGESDKLNAEEKFNCHIAFQRFIRTVHLEPSAERIQTAANSLSAARNDGDFLMNTTLEMYIASLAVRLWVDIRMTFIPNLISEDFVMAVQTNFLGYMPPGPSFGR